MISKLQEAKLQEVRDNLQSGRMSSDGHGTVKINDIAVLHYIRLLDECISEAGKQKDCETCKHDDIFNRTNNSNCFECKKTVIVLRSNWQAK